MKAIRSSTWAAVLVLASSVAIAHHGAAGVYDMTKTVKVEGTVTAFQWRNPHSQVYVQRKDATGQDVTYSFEMGSPQSLVKDGYTRTSFKPGDMVVLQMHPSFNNPAFGILIEKDIVINGKELPIKRSLGED